MNRQGYREYRKHTENKKELRIQEVHTENKIENDTEKRRDPR